MRMQIAYTLIAFTALAILVLIARSRLRRVSRPTKHLRIDLLAVKGDDGPRSEGHAGQSSLP
jgi:hypothetical protein